VCCLSLVNSDSAKEILRKALMNRDPMKIRKRNRDS
jgi:hypothetical protein